MLRTFDSKTRGGGNVAPEQYGDPVAMGVLDPTKVTSDACRMRRWSRA